MQPSREPPDHAESIRENALDNLKIYWTVLFLLNIAPSDLQGGEQSPIPSLSGDLAGLDSRAESDPTISAALRGGRTTFRGEDGKNLVTAHLSLPDEQAQIWNIAVPTEPRRRSAFAKVMNIISYVAFPFFLFMGFVGHLRMKHWRVTLDDFVGIDQIEGELREIVDFLRDPRKFSRFNDDPPKGVLLVAPFFNAMYIGSGLNRTRIVNPQLNSMLASAIAIEAGVPFFRFANSGFMKNLRGPDDSLAHGVFERARKDAPCIVYIDDIAEFGRASAKVYGWGNERRRRKLNRIVGEMRDSEANVGIVAFAATGRPEALDPALLDSDCFARQIKVPRFGFKRTRGRAILSMLALIAFLLPLIALYYNCANADAPFSDAFERYCSIFR